MIAHAREMLHETFTDWIRHRRQMREFRQLDRTEFGRIASDLRISPDELEEIVHQGPHSADELPKLLRALGIDDAALANAQPQMLQDMERVCALCGQKRQCDRNLVEGNATEYYQRYCPDASTIAKLCGTRPSKP
jgi:hypothetical protein